MAIPCVSPYVSALYPVRFDGCQTRQSLSSPPPLLYVPLDPRGGVSSPACQSLLSPPPLLYVPHNSNLDPRGGMPSPLQFCPSSFSTPSPQHNLNVLKQQYTMADPKETLPTGTNSDSALSDDRDCVQQFQHQDSPTSSATPTVAKEKRDHTTRRRLKRRMSDTTNKKRYQCDVCRQRFLQRSDLTKHMRTHKGMPFQCVFCKKRFTRNCNLVTHMEQVYHSKTFVK